MVPGSLTVAGVAEMPSDGPRVSTAGRMVKAVTSVIPIARTVVVPKVARTGNLYSNRTPKP